MHPYEIYCTDNTESQSPGGVDLNRCTPRVHSSVDASSNKLKNMATAGQYIKPICFDVHDVREKIAQLSACKPSLRTDARTGREKISDLAARRVHAQIMYNASVGIRSNSSTNSLIWKDIGRRSVTRQYSEQTPQLQIYASYDFRHDFVHRMKPGERIINAEDHPKSQADLEAVHGYKFSNVPRQPPVMQKALAWELILRNIHKLEMDVIGDELKRDHNASQIRSLNISVLPQLRHERLVYVPVFSIHYVYGETFNVHGERHAQSFHALIGGTADGDVVATRHISVPKASIAGGGLTGGVLGLLSVLSLYIAKEPPMFTPFDIAFSALGVGAITGLVVQMLPALRQGPSTAAWEEQRAFSLPSSPTQDAARIQEEILRTNSEWDRWEEADIGTWDPLKRREWAEQLLKSQHARRQKRVKMEEHMQRQQQQRKMEEIRERRRQARWGDSASSRSRHSYDPLMGNVGFGGRKDYLGYYNALGIDPKVAWQATQQDIKSAFRVAAQRWHPDKHGQAAKEHALAKFQEIQVAYETLKDPERRKQYDLGELRGKG